MLMLQTLFVILSSFSHQPVYCFFSFRFRYHFFPFHFAHDSIQTCVTDVPLKCGESFVIEFKIYLLHFWQNKQDWTVQCNALCTRHRTIALPRARWSTCLHHKTQQQRPGTFFEVVVVGWTSALEFCQTWQFESHDFKSAGKINSAEKGRGKRE